MNDLKLGGQVHGDNATHRDSIVSFGREKKQVSG